MEITIDKSGRVVLPKPLRDRLGLRPGRRLRLDEQGSSLLLTPEHEDPLLTRRGGLLVVTAKPSEPVDWDHLVENEREARIKEMWER